MERLDGRVPGAQESEFSAPPVKNPDPGDPMGPASQKWVEVVSGRRSNVELGYD
jgi:hypothetical protein